MNLSASQCSSDGCESGWTLYLDQSSLSKNQNELCSSGDGNGGGKEDLSMVSDASSGPPHYCEHNEDFSVDENGCYCSPRLASELALRKSKNKKTMIEQQQHHSYLNDTASTPVKKNISFSKEETSMEHVLDFSQGFSATHLKGKSTFKKHFDFLQSSLAPKKGGFKEESGKDEWQL